VVGEVTTTLASTGFRALMAHYPTGVVAVTALRSGRPVGLSVGSFLSLSLEPVLVGFGVTTTSTSWPRIAEEPTFGINILAADQGAVSSALAAPRPHKFHTIDWTPARPCGTPVIHGALAYLGCRLHASHRTGDHDFVVAEVHTFQQLRVCGPLLFHERRYRTVTDAAKAVSPA